MVFDCLQIGASLLYEFAALLDFRHAWCILWPVNLAEVQLSALQLPLDPK